jgi:hypothetical protein
MLLGLIQVGGGGDCPIVAVDPFLVAGAETGETRKSVHVITTDTSPGV